MAVALVASAILMHLLGERTVQLVLGLTLAGAAIAMTLWAIVDPH